MNIINKLTIRYLKENKKQTLVTLIGVILSVTMITAVATSAASFMDLIQRRVILTDGNWHVFYDDVPKENLTLIEQDTETKQSFLSQELGHAKLVDYKGNKPYLHVMAFNEEATEAFPVDLKQGRFPLNSHEIVISEDAIYNSSATYAIGDTITLEIGQRINQFGERIFQDQWGDDSERIVSVKEYVFTVVGISTEPRYVSSWGPAYTAITALDDELYSTFSSVDVSVQLHHVSPALYNHADELSDAVHVHDSESMVSVNKELLRCYGVTGIESFNTMIYALASFFMAVIMVGSVSVIYNAFSISASKRTKHLGMLASVGATKSQKCGAILFEGAVIGAIAIPIGLLLGTVGMGMTFKLINPIFEAHLGSELALRLVISVASLGVATLVSMLTIFISAWIPARRASKVSPMIAIRQNNEVKISRRSVKTAKLVMMLFGVEGDLALKNLKRQKRRYRATVFSLVLSIVLFLITTYYMNELKAAYSLTQANLTYDLAIYGDSETYGYETSSRTRNIILVDEIISLDLVKDYSVVQPVYFNLNLSKDQLSSDYLKVLEQHNLDDLDDISLKVLGILDEEFAKYAKPTTSNHLQVVLLNEARYILDNTYIRLSPLKETKDLQLKSTSIAIDVIGYATEAPIGIDLSSDPEQLVALMPLSSLSPLIENNRTNGYGNLGIYLSTDSPDELEEEINDLYIKQGLPTPSLQNVSQEHEADMQFIFLISVFVYGFISLITLICLVNVFNTITTSMLLRTREFAMIKSVGMDNKSFHKMIAFESLFYGLKALLYGLPISVLLMAITHHILSKNFIMAFTLPWGSFVIAILGVFIFVSLSMWYSLVQLKKLNLIEALKQENA